MGINGLKGFKKREVNQISSRSDHLEKITKNIQKN